MAMAHASAGGRGPARLTLAATLLAFAAIPPGSPMPDVPGLSVTDFSSPPMWVSYHGVEKWIPDPSSCIRGACVSVPAGVERFSPIVRVKRGELLVFHFLAPKSGVNLEL